MGKNHKSSQTTHMRHAKNHQLAKWQAKEHDSFNRPKCLSGKPYHYFANITVRKREKKSTNSERTVVFAQHMCFILHAIGTNQ